MYQSKYIFKDDLTIEIIKHNGIIIISDDNYNKMRYIDYNLKDAITNFKNQYK
jgi:DNA-binding transcriptional MocR family regulator